MLTEFAKISPETIQHVSNFLSTDKNELVDTNRRNNNFDEGPPDTEDAVYLDNPEMSDDMSSSDQADSIENKNWLRHTLIAVCPNFDILVIGAAQKFVVLERSKSTVPTMEIAAKVRVTEEEHVYISALTTFGVAPERSNASSRSLSMDWICISIGLSNGSLMFYTDRGVLLFLEKCASISLLSIRIGPSAHPGNQELVIMTDESKLIVIESLSLYIALRTARRLIAHGERTAEELSEQLELNSQQLRIHNLRRVNDVQLAGLSTLTAFDQYVNAFYAGGRKETISHYQHIPVYSQYICTIGSKGGSGSHHHHLHRHNNEEHHPPMVERDYCAFILHSIHSNDSNNTLTDALFSITSKISNNIIPSFGIRSFIGVGVSRKDRPPKKQWLQDAPSTTIYVKSALRDENRLSERAFLAPNAWNLVAITDNIGRVLLIHTTLRRILRIWKGYRQARCGWLEVESPTFGDDSPKPKKALFLVIFAPKRGLLEVWSMQNGPRVCACEVADAGRLISVPSAQFGILHGAVGSTADGIKSYKNPHSAVVFLSPNGSFYSLNVPFHLSATALNSQFKHKQ